MDLIRFAQAIPARAGDRPVHVRGAFPVGGKRFGGELLFRDLIVGQTAVEHGAGNLLPGVLPVRIEAPSPGAITLYEKCVVGLYHLVGFGPIELVTPLVVAVSEDVIQERDRLAGGIRFNLLLELVERGVIVVELVADLMFQSALHHNDPVLGWSILTEIVRVDLDRSGHVRVATVAERDTYVVTGRHPRDVLHSAADELIIYLIAVFSLVHRQVLAAAGLGHSLCQCLCLSRRLSR